MIANSFELQCKLFAVTATIRVAFRPLVNSSLIKHSRQCFVQYTREFLFFSLNLSQCKSKKSIISSEKGLSPVQLLISTIMLTSCNNFVLCTVSFLFAFVAILFLLTDFFGGLGVITKSFSLVLADLTNFCCMCKNCLVFSILLIDSASS